MSLLSQGRNDLLHSHFSIKVRPMLTDSCPLWFTSTHEHGLIMEWPLCACLYVYDDQPPSPWYLFQTTLNAPSMFPSKKWNSQTINNLMFQFIPSSHSLTHKKENTKGHPCSHFVVLIFGNLYIFCCSLAHSCHNIQQIFTEYLFCKALSIRQLLLSKIFL